MTTPPRRLTTDRLELLPLTAEALAALVDNDGGRLTALTGARVVGGG